MGTTDLPMPPGAISDDGHEAWDWAMRLSDTVQRRAKASELRASIASRTCGDCTSWMTKGCPREKHGGMTGRRTGPAGNAPICGSFAENASSTARRERQSLDLAALEA